MVFLTAATATLAALLAFLVEPMVGKLLLPSFGGTAAVWTTALVFFQAALLAGYALAHLLIGWLGVRRAALVELVVVCIPLLALPVGLPTEAVPPPGAPPAVWLGGVLTIAVGAPFVALATATPTLQRWLGAAGSPTAGQGAVRLFAGSNAGSLIALLAYPTLIEPNLDLDAQARLWAVGYLTFVGLVVVGVVVVLRRTPRTRPSPAASIVSSAEPVESGPSAPDPDRAAPSRRTRLAWIGLAAIPAALVVGTTAHLSTDVAAVPMLWVIPLAVYLATFILAFAGRRPIGLRTADVLLPPLALGVVISLIAGAALPLWLIFAIHLGALGCAGLVCHGRLSLARPIPERLTEYDLGIAAGGALGGLLGGIVAPLLLVVPIEGQIALVFALAVRWGAGWSDAQPGHRTEEAAVPGRRGPVARALVAVRRVAAAAWRTPFLARYSVAALALVLGLAWFGIEADAGAVVGALVLGLLLGVARWPAVFAAAMGAVFLLSLIAVQPAIETIRTFYGERRVVEDARGRHALLAGTTIQGIQHYLPIERRRDPVGYYHAASPLADVVGMVDGRHATARIGVIGLGVGGLAAYGRPGDSLTFYEIDPGVVDIARDPHLFTYLADTRARVDVVVGDGRLELVKAPVGAYDLIVVDAFDSDSIPVHLLTREAIEAYFERLGPEDVVAFNVSNRFVALEPVLAAAARDLGLAGLARLDDPTPSLDSDADASDVVVLARSPDDLATLAARPGWRPLVTPIQRAWTDRYSDLFGSFGAP